MSGTENKKSLGTKNPGFARFAACYTSKIYIHSLTRTACKPYLKPFPGLQLKCLKLKPNVVYS